MNAAVACIAISLACAFGSTAARAQSPSASLPGSAAGVSPSASVPVAGLSLSSYHALPGFPTTAYRDGRRHGRVVLGYRVNADGTVRDIEVLEASPVQVFTRTATNALAGWRFTPTGTSEQRRVEFLFQAD